MERVTPGSGSTKQLADTLEMLYEHYGYSGLRMVVCLFAFSTRFTEFVATARTLEYIPKLVRGHLHNVMEYFGETRIKVNAFKNPWSNLCGEIASRKSSSATVMMAGLAAASGSYGTRLLSTKTYAKL